MKIFAVVFLLALSSQAADPSGVTGKWKTIDDETGKAKSIVEIYEDNGTYSGRIVKLFLEPHEVQNPNCDKCTGEKKDKPITGLQILSGLKKDGDKWSGGDIMDPKNGKTYSCKAELAEGGAKLKLRGFIGFSLLGRTQTWIREP